MFINCYKILEISNNASENEIKKAFRKLAIQYHPDKNKSINSQNEFIKIKKAYDILIDYNKRKKHDEELRINESTFSTESRLKKDSDEYSRTSSTYNSEKYQSKFDEKRRQPNQRYRYEEGINEVEKMKTLIYFLGILLSIIFIAIIYNQFKNSKIEVKKANSIKSDSEIFKEKLDSIEKNNESQTRPQTGELKF